MANLELNTPTLNLMSFGSQVTKQTDNNYTDADKAKVDGIEAGAEVNVIEEVKCNGSALPVTDKAVNVVVPTKVSELDNDANFATTTQLSDEATARTNADTTLQGNIDSETTARANADATLQANIEEKLNISDSTDTERALAAIILELQARISALESMLNGGNIGDVQCNSLIVFGKSKTLFVGSEDNDDVIVRKVAPATIPTRAGQIYVDQGNTHVYISTNNSSVSNWLLVK